jgi:hypothetical protein
LILTKSMILIVSKTIQRSKHVLLSFEDVPRKFSLSKFDNFFRFDRFGDIQTDFLYSGGSGNSSGDPSPIRQRRAPRHPDAPTVLSPLSPLRLCRSNLSIKLSLFPIMCSRAPAAAANGSDFHPALAPIKCVSSGSFLTEHC